jgi:hypothetical protein
VPPSGRTYHVVPGPEGCAAATTIEVAADTVCTGVPLSATVAVKLYVPFAVGVPDMIPVLAAIVSPAGRAPAVTDHV